VGESFEVSLKPEDKHGNVSGDIKLIKRELAEEGVHRLELADGRTNPISSAPMTGGYQLFWGDIHGHCSSTPPEYGPSHGLGTPTEYHEFARDVARLDFVALTEYVPDDHEYRQEVVRQYHDPGRFVPFFALEWGGSHTGLKGHVHVVYAEDRDIPLPPAKRNPPDDPRLLIESLRSNGQRALVIPHHTNAQRDHDRQFSDAAGDMFGEHLDHAKTLRIADEGWGPWCWWQDYPDYIRLFEICQMRGSFELDRLEKGVMFAGYGASAQNALAKGLRWGFTGSTDTHLGRPGDRDALLCLGTERRGGMTAVLAKQLTRQALFEALCARRCYATTFARIILDVSVNGQPMGSELTLPPRAEAHISVAVHGTDTIDRVEIVRNNVDVHCVQEGCEDVSFDWSDQLPAEGSSFYYVRVTQRDGEMAWSSPVWIQMEP